MKGLAEAKAAADRATAEAETKTKAAPPVAVELRPAADAPCASTSDAVARAGSVTGTKLQDARERDARLNSPAWAPPPPLPSPPAPSRASVPRAEGSGLDGPSFEVRGKGALPAGARQPLDAKAAYIRTAETIRRNAERNESTIGDLALKLAEMQATTGELRTRSAFRRPGGAPESLGAEGASGRPPTNTERTRPHRPAGELAGLAAAAAAAAPRRHGKTGNMLLWHGTRSY